MSDRPGYFTIDRAYLAREAKEGLRNIFAPFTWPIVVTRRVLRRLGRNRR